MSPTETIRRYKAKHTFKDVIEEMYSEKPYEPPTEMKNFNKDAENTFDFFGVDKLKK